MNPYRLQRLVLLTVAAVCGASVGCTNSVIPESWKSADKKTKSPAVKPRKPANHQPVAPAGNPVANRRPPIDPASARQLPPENRVVNRRPPSTTAPGGSADDAQYIHLSTGTALPQTLPQGERVLFTAEYQFRGGGPRSGVKYVLVVEGRGGKSVRFPLSTLNSRGELPARFGPVFRSTDAPFRGYIEEWPASSGRRKPGDGKRVSNIVPMS